MNEMNRMKSIMLSVTRELIAGCRFCVEISADPDEKTPIQCTKFSGGSSPIFLNAATCLSCQEFRKTNPAFSSRSGDIDENVE
ncbi:hypothetical protein [Paenibacillus koleovorans]|uniref:hypothetical protein n=1 Tax=Paenibacillus koleovorans TaxID=121608 RepID=UPI000FD8F06E|nr:hypothetical protein [Paenibacillus koleovorans]